MSNCPLPNLVADTVYRDAGRRRGTVQFDRLIFEILNSLTVENNEVTQEDQEHIKESIEAKFQEKDVVLAVNKFIEQKGRRPFLMEFCEFIQNWEDKLINENIEFSRENRGVRDENRTLRDVNTAVNNEKQALEDKCRALQEELNRHRSHSVHF